MAKKKKPDTEFPECPACHRLVDQNARTCRHCGIGFQKPRRGENRFKFRTGRNYPDGYFEDGNKP